MDFPKRNSCSQDNNMPKSILLKISIIEFNFQIRELKCKHNKQQILHANIPHDEGFNLSTLIK